MNIQTDQRQIGSLFCRTVTACDAPQKAVVFCHGYGAPGTDLVGLAPEMMQMAPALKDARFYFPEAPLELPMMFGARAWWPIDMARLEMAIQTGQTRQMRDEVPEGLKSARQKLLSTVNAIAAELSLSPKDILLGGFSQGAMLTTDVALHTDDAFAGLIVFSGALLNEKVWIDKASRRKGFRVFQSHGSGDPLLGFAQAKDLQALFTNAGFDNAFVEFAGGHTIGGNALSGGSLFAADCLFG